MRNPMTWIIAAIVVLSLGSVVAAIVISEQHDVADGYIPPDER